MIERTYKAVFGYKIKSLSGYLIVFLKQTYRWEFLPYSGKGRILRDR